jgi:hypothetical protein
MSSSPVPQLDPDDSVDVLKMPVGRNQIGSGFSIACAATQISLVGIGLPFALSPWAILE